MPAPRFRSRKFRRVKTRIPSGKSIIHYKRRKPAKHRCGMCGNVLQAVPNQIPSKIKKLSKSQRRPQRPFGGVLCSKCMREVSKESVRK